MARADDSTKEALLRDRSKQESQTLQDMRDKFNRLLPTVVYGKVIDQNGNVIPNADIEFRWYQQSWLIGKADYGTTRTLVTDERGCFSVTCPKLDRAYAVVSKSGYETPSSTSDEIKTTTSEEHPAIFVIRKKAATTYLIVQPAHNSRPEQFKWITHGDKTSVIFDVISRLGEKPIPATYADLAFDAAFDANRVCWSLTVSATNGTDGIVVDNDMLYEAPVAGYAAVVSFSITNAPHQRGGVYLYLKSRSPAVYTRFRLEYDQWDDPLRDGKSLRLFYKAWTNPYGERSLEADERVTENNWRTRKELTAEAVQAIRSGRLPAKPDIERRIRETDEKVVREEAVKERRHQEWLEEMEKLRAAEKAK